MEKQSHELIEIESIKSLKAKYFRTMDMKDWRAFAECFTEDLVTDFSEAKGRLGYGRDDFVDRIRKTLENAVSIHHGDMPEIQLIDDEQAKGIWAVEYIVTLPELSIQSWGHSHEEYRKEDGVWKISSIKLSRLRVLHDGEEVEMHS